MGKYHVLAPALVVHGNKVTRYSKPTTEAVSINDDDAKKLGDKVRAVGEAGPTVEEEKPAPKPDTKGSVDATPSQQASAAAATTQKGARK